MCGIIIPLTQVEYTDLVWQSGLCNLQTACRDFSSEFVPRERERERILPGVLSILSENNPLHEKVGSGIYEQRILSLACTSAQSDPSRRIKIHV